MKQFWILAILASGCGKKPGSYEVSSAAENSATDQLAEQAETLWQQRGDKEKLTEALNAYEQLFVQDPKNQEVAARLVRGWYFYGDAHEADIEAKKAAWDKAISFGQKCLAVNEEYKAILGKYAPEGNISKKLYNIAEKIRCENIGSSYFKGIKDNIEKYYLKRITGLDLKNSDDRIVESFENYLRVKFLNFRNESKIENKIAALSEIFPFTNGLLAVRFIFESMVLSKK